MSVDAADPFQSLLHAHDLIWEDKTWPLQIRITACQLLWTKALEILHIHYGNASTANSLEHSVDKVLAKDATVKP